MDSRLRDDLASCLAFSLPEAERQPLIERLNGGGWQRLLNLADAWRLTPALAVGAEAKGLTAGIPAVRLPDGRATATAELADALAVHRERQAVLLGRLRELLDAFAAQGIEAILLKGARALWTGEPPWRTLRDFDLLIPEPDTLRAQQIAIDIGYRTDKEAGSVPDRWHHAENLYRDDLPGWLEIHGMAAMYRADVLLPTPMLIAEAVEIEGSHGTARALSMPCHILHCLLHHHIGHRGDKWGTMDLKGLYEFAADIDGLDEEGRHELLITALGHPRLLAMLDFWLAAAAALFRLEVRAPLAVHDDALRRWRTLSARTGSNRRRGDYDGLIEEATMAMRGARLRRLPAGQSFIGRQRLRLAVVRSLLAPATEAPSP